MAKISERLSAVKVASLKAPGYYADGANLYFRIAPSGARGWIFRFAMGGRTRDAGLGAYPGIGLAAARNLAGRFREQVKAGVDPIERRRADMDAERVAGARSLCFDDCARQYIGAHEAGWKNAKHRAQWTKTLTSYVSPAFGKLPAAAVDTAMVLRAIEPIWQRKPETASRVRGRIESVLDWARVHGYRSGENPARWKGHLDQILPARDKVRRVKHHAALPYTNLCTFMAELRDHDDASAPALEFTILTATRTSEAIGATWDEIDLNTRTWTIPGERIKAGKEHRVPLSSAALAILKSQLAMRTDRFVFSGGKFGRPLSDMAMLMLLRRMGHAVTVHGFRSTFRDWAAERTIFPREVVEMALAHAIGNAVEAAYRRGDLFEKRRRLMQAWADHCAFQGSGKILPIQQGLRR